VWRRPLGIGLQEQVSNRRMLLGLRALGGERSGQKVRLDRIRYGIRRRTKVNRRRGVVSELQEVESRNQRCAVSEVHRVPAYWVDGLRHKDGAN
jgi:hypothetical protein